jgi:hypothetical protein
LSSARPDALPVGLALGVLVHPDVNGRLDKAIGKLEERYLGEWLPMPMRYPVGVRLQQTACSNLIPPQKHQLLQRTDQILQEVGAESFAYLSNTSPTGFEHG